MLKKTITYQDWDGNSVTEDFYFNINEAELIELEVSLGKKGFMETVKEAINAETNDVVVDAFKRLIRLSIGKRDGKLFVKNDEITNEFMQTNAYPALFMELVTNASSGAAFVNGIMPQTLVDKAASDKNQLVMDMQAKTEEMKLPEAIPAVPVSQENLENVEAAARPLAADFAAMSAEEFENWKNSQV